MKYADSNKLKEDVSNLIDKMFKDYATGWEIYIARSKDGKVRLRFSVEQY